MSDAHTLPQDEAPAIAAGPPDGPDRTNWEFKTILLNRRDEILSRIMAANIRLGELKNQAGPKAEGLRKIIAFYREMLNLIEKHGGPLFKDSVPSADEIPGADEMEPAPASL